MFKFLDAYSLRARLFPAVLAAAPAIAALALLISWDRIALSNVIATTALCVLVFALAEFSRKLGVRVEPKIYEVLGGKPSVTMFRRNDTTIEEPSKERYRQYIAEQINQPVPTARQEGANQANADVFYEACGTWLRARTRDAKKFPMLFGENVGYGFWRNLFGLKWPALALNVIIVGICAGMLWYRRPLDIDSDLTMRILVVLIIAAIHSLWFAFAVTKNSVMGAARKYGRQLILSTEELINTSQAPAKKPKTPTTAHGQK